MRNNKIRNIKLNCNVGLKGCKGLTRRRRKVRNKRE